MTGVSRWRYELLALAVGLLGVVAHLQTVAPIVGASGTDYGVVHRGVAQLEGRASDLKFRIRGVDDSPTDVVVVAIDERSTHKYGLWPWSRSVMAQLLTKLVDLNVKAIGMDMTFTDMTADPHEVERQVLTELLTADPLPEALVPLKNRLMKAGQSTPDDELEAAFRHGARVIVQGAIPFGEAERDRDFSLEQTAQFNALVEPYLLKTVTLGSSGVTLELPIKTLPMWSNYSAQMPLPRFAGAGTRVGHFSMVPDVDGTIRRMALFSKLTGPTGLLPAMSLETAAQSLGAEIEPGWNRGESDLQGASLRLPDESRILVPFEPSSSFTLIDYEGPGSHFKTISAVDVLNGTAGIELIGKTVLLGVTIAGSSGDQRVTPFKEIEPGVYTHAAMVSNILKRQFLTRPWFAKLAELVAMLVLCIGLGAMMGRSKSFVVKAIIAVAGCGAWLVADYVLFLKGTQVSTVVPLATLLASSFGTIFLGYLSVDREKLKMRSTFTRYLGEDVMEVALANPDLLNRGEKREMTVLFSDIRGFTTLSERMTPEVLADFINQYLSPMTKIVFDEKGTLDKYIGDAVMAFWNAPLTQADHAIRACRASVKMLIKLEELKAGWRAKGLPELEIGIGVNTGQMIVGNMGSDVRVDYTVLGDSVNLGSRLEGTNKEYDTKIIIAESTWVFAKDVMICRRLGGVRVKGKRLPVNIFELRGEGQPAGDEAIAIATFEQALTEWTNRRFDHAKALFEKVLTLWPGDYPSRKYLTEIEGFAANPPPSDWDGVSSLTSK